MGNKDGQDENFRDKPGASDKLIEAALAEFQEACFAGERPDIDEFCRHRLECGPKLRREIEDFLFVLEKLPEAGKRDDDGAARSSAAGEEKPHKRIGDFTIIKEIGRGGMGTVYEAEQVSLKRRVALKLLPSHLTFSDEAVLKFRREAEAGGRQSHPGIVTVHSVGEHEGVHYIAQELVEGSHTLADKLEELRKTGEQPPGYFREVAQLIAETADALQHAHDSGVIHRDIKPSNILLDREGRPKVTDFGIAKVEDALALSRTGDFAGTPYYMSPEQAMSRRIDIDKRTDIYSLGVTLYEMLTLQRPFEGKTSYEVLKKIILFDPLDPHKSNSKVPRDLSVICLKAMEKIPERRYQGMREFADELRRFLSGDVIMAKPVGVGTRILKRVKRNPIVSTAVGVALAAIVVFAVVVPWVIVTKEREKREAEENARIEIEKQRDIADTEKQKAIAAKRESDQRYEEIIRLADVKRLSDLESEEQELWPAFPEKIGSIKDWIRRAEDLIARLDVHEKTLTRLRLSALPYDNGNVNEEHNWTFEDTETQWRHDTLHELVTGLVRLADEEGGILKNVEERLAFASTIEKRSIDDCQELWDEAIASIADESECPQYQGLLIERVIGFVPIGQDPESGLWEFAHLQTGEIPLRDTDGKLFMDEDMGLVLVLIPGGSFDMGTRLPSEENPLGSPNVDPRSVPNETPVHKVSIEPFFLSKYEMTQGQWLRFTGENPSANNPKHHVPFWNRYGEPITLLHPVEGISWNDCARELARLKLRLPSEAEWEYAARAGTTTPWWTGNDKKSLLDAANLADLFCKSSPGTSYWVYEEWLDDGYVVHAPVGRFKPNPFGLYDIYGNLWEMCQDSYGEYKYAPTDGSPYEDPSTPYRVTRGGGWFYRADACRSAARNRGTTDKYSNHTGVRPAASLH